MAPSVQRRKDWLTPTTRVLCSNDAKTRNPLKFARVPQTRQQMSPISRLTILSGHVAKVLLFNMFFPLVDQCLSSEDIARQICAMVQNGDFCVLYFQRAALQHISDMHSKFALRPHNAWKYGRHPISDR